MSDGDSCRLKYFEGEPEVLAEVRQMWDEIFDDPEEFADYYFTEICKQNKILLAYKGDVLAGMIHLNPYEMQVEGKKETVLLHSRSGCETGISGAGHHAQNDAARACRYEKGRQSVCVFDAGTGRIL